MSFFFQNVDDSFVSRRAAFFGLTIGGIVILLGLLLRAYAGLGAFGMHFLTSTGALLAASVIFLQIGTYFCRMPPPQSLAEAIRYRDLKSLEKFKSEIYSRDQEGKSPLLLALEEFPDAPGCDPFVQFLVNNGADVTIHSVRSPLHTAIFHKHSPETITLLLDKGANINALSMGQPPLNVAIACNNEAITRLLIERGANVPTRDGNQPAITWALKGGYNENLCLLLIDADTKNLDTPDRLGMTPLEWAIARNQYVVFEKLLAKGADLNIKAHNGEWLFHSVIKAKRIEALKLLVSFGADQSKIDRNGNTTVDLMLLHSLDLKYLALSIPTQEINS